MIGHRRRAVHAPPPDRRLAVIVLVVAFVVNLGGFAYAAYVTSGSGAAQSQAETLSAPTHLQLHGAVTATSVPIGWSAPVDPAPTGYVVYRCAGPACAPTATDVITAGGCASTLGHPVSATECVDTDPTLTASTTYGYAVAAVDDTWQSALSAPLSVAIPGRPDVAQSPSAGDRAAPGAAPSAGPDPPTGTPTGSGATKWPAKSTVGASLAGLAPTTGTVGSSVTIAASGFAASTPLTVTVGGAGAHISTGGTTGANGAATVTFAVPVVSNGAQPVVVSDGSTSVSSAVEFSVQAAVGLSSIQGAAGSVVAISGTGFSADAIVAATFGQSTVTLGGTTATGATGSFAGTTLVVPPDGAASYQVVVTDAKGASASARYVLVGLRSG